VATALAKAVKYFPICFIAGSPDRWDGVNTPKQKAHS